MNLRLLQSSVAGLLLFMAGSGWIRAEELIAPALLDEVSVRNLPAFTVIETDTTGSLDASWIKGFRLGARYAALAHSGLNTPTMITFPDWEKSPTAEGTTLHVLVQCLIDPLPDLPRVRDRSATVQAMPAMTVACYAHRGVYSPASFMSGLKTIQEHLKARGIPIVGPPRYLYYSNSAWMPSWWRVSEVQVPIPSGIRQN